MDNAQLMKRCLSPISAFYNEGVVTNTKNGVYIYKDNGSNILAIAHLDVVNTTKHFKIRERRGVIRCGQLDDRLGAHVILDILPKMGINVDVLLTEGEETNRSTAEFFTTTKKYNWIFSFDRRGEDVVGYKFDDDYWKKKVISAGFKPSTGTFSDIAKLEDLGCKGLNIGVGYHDEHSPGAHLVISQLERQLKRFEVFHRLYRDVHMPHKKVIYSQQQFEYRNYDYFPAGNNPNYLHTEVTMEVDPEVMITIEGYKPIVMPLSVFAADISAPYELKQLLRSGHMKANYTKFSLTKFLIPEDDKEEVKQIEPPAKMPINSIACMDNYYATE